MTKKYVFFFLCVLFVLYAILLIGKASFVVHNTRYFVLFDDEMVSMRYAKNFAHGFGLVWNKGGERVEGFTNPLWTGYMALLHLLPIPLAKMGLTIQMTGVLLSLLTLYVIKKLSGILALSPFAQISALIFSAFYFPLVNWGVILGTEVSFLSFLTTLQVFLAVKSLKEKRLSLALFVTCGIAALVRLDALVPSVTIIAFLFISEKSLRRNILFRGLPIFLFFLGCQEALRLWYYHELLPNTYYLKATGFPILLRMTRGFFVSLQMINPILSAAVIITVFLKKNRFTTLLLLLILTETVYSIFVGGDAWEFFGGTNRYISIVMPLFLILLSQTLSHFGKVLPKQALRKKRRTYALKISSIAFLLLVLNTSSADEFVQWTTIKESYAMGQNRYQVDIAESIKRITTPQATVAITLAGVTPYFSDDRYFVDLLGKNDKHIARMSVSMDQIPQNKLKRFIIYNPGHMKSDFFYSLTTYNPDIVVQPLTDAGNPLLSNNYQKVRLHNEYDFFLKKGSQNILWKNIANENSGYQL